MDDENNESEATLKDSAVNLSEDVDMEGGAEGITLEQLKLILKRLEN